MDTFFETWDRYKNKLPSYPQQDLNVHQEIQTLYNGINFYMKQLANTHGLITKRNQVSCKEIIKNMVKHSREWHSSRDGRIQASAMTEGSDGLT